MRPGPTEPAARRPARRRLSASARALLLLLLAFALMGGDCSAPPPPAALDTPTGFVQVNDGAFEYKAVSPEGATIAVRHRPNQEEGDLAFWSEVFRLEMVESKGYRLVDTSEVTSSDGVAGRLMRFEVAVGETPYSYTLAVYVTPKGLVTLETGAKLEALPSYEEAFKSARASLRAKVFDPPEG